MLAIYCRISKDRPNQQSIDVQKNLGQDFAKQNGFKFSHYIDQGISGGGDSSKRPAYTKMMKDIEDGKIKAVYSYDQDRLQREESEYFSFIETMLKHDVLLYESGRLIDLDDESDRMMGSFKAVIAASFKRKTAKNTKLGLKRSVSKGKGRSIYPYGYTKDKDGIMVVDEEEKIIVNRIYDMSLSGIGTNKIAEIFNVERIPTRYNKIGGTLTTKDRLSGIVREKKKKDIKWSGNTIRNIIKNTVYKGERHFSGEVYESPILIEPHYWQKVNEHLKENRNTQHGNEKRHEYLLRGLLRCGRCGRNYYGRINKRDNYYMCSSKRIKTENCGNRSINIPKIEYFIWSRFFMEGEFKLLLDKYFHELSDKPKSIELKRLKTNLEKDIQNLEKQLLRAKTLVVKGVLEDGDFIEQKNRIKGEINSKVLKLSDIDKQLHVIQNIETSKKETLFQINALKKNMSFAEMKRVVNKYIDHITIHFIHDSDDATRIKTIKKDGSLGNLKIQGHYYLEFNFKIPSMKPETFAIDQSCTYAASIGNSIEEVSKDFNQILANGHVSKVYALQSSMEDPLFYHNIRKTSEGKFELDHRPED